MSRAVRMVAGKPGTRYSEAHSVAGLDAAGEETGKRPTNRS